jgi:hypothetical protein
MKVAMQSLRRSPYVRSTLCAAALALASPRALLAQETPSTTQPTAAEVTGPLDQARELIKSGDYDRAIEDLKGVIGKERTKVATLREAYLLLIKTYVFLGNDYKLKPQGREASNLNYKAAREMIAECLRVKELRHTQPEPASEYPPEMVSFFGEVRARLFGSLIVSGTTPVGASILLDGDTLRILSEKNAFGDVDLTVGRHAILIRYPGYQDLTEDITIPPNSTLERSYQLKKRRGRLWYASRVGAAIGVASLVAVLTKPRAERPPTPLPTAPPPPSQ